MSIDSVPLQPTPRLNVRATLMGAAVALVLSIGTVELFNALRWPGRHFAQWAAFYGVMMATSRFTSARPVPGKLIAVYVIATLLCAWLTKSFTGP